MTTPSRGWKLALTPVPALAVEAMPKALQTAVLRYLSALALEAGGAVEAGNDSVRDSRGPRNDSMGPGDPARLPA